MGNQAEAKAEAASFRSLYRFAGSFDGALLCLGGLALLGSAANQPMQLIVFGRILDSFNGSDKDKIIGEIHFLAFCYALLGVQQIVTISIQISCFSWVASRQAGELRKRYFEALLRRPPGFYDENDSGAFATSVLGLTGTVADGLGDSFAQALQTLGQFLTGVIVAIYLAWRLALVVLVGIPFLGFLVAFAQKAFNKQVHASSNSLEQASSIALERIAAIRTVASLGNERMAMSQYQEGVGFACRMGVKQGRAKAILEGCLSPIIFVLFGLGLWYGSFLVSSDMEDNEACRWVSNSGEAQDPDASKCHTGGNIMTAFLCILFGFLGLLQGLPGFTALAEARASAAKLFRVIDMEPSSMDPLAESGEKPTVHGLIELKNVSFAYPARPDILVYNGMNLTISPGQTVALAGPSGCGKSTLVSLLERFYDISGGEILLDGQNIKNLNLRWLRTQIGLVSQEPVLFEGSIGWNIKLGCDGTTQEQIEKAAQLSNAHDFVSQLPGGYETFVGEKGIQLSGGQKQRVAIARALVRDPAILILDEATSALDTASERLVQAALDKLLKQKKRTTIVIAHRLCTIQEADKIAIISEGKVAEEGTHLELIQRENGIYRSLVQAQLSSADDTEKEQTRVTSLDEVDVSVQKASDKEGAKALENATSKEEPSPTKEVPDKADKKATPLGWLWQQSAPEKYYYVSGLLGSTITGLAMPAIGFLMAEFIVVFFNPDVNEMRREALKWAIIFLGMGFMNSFGAVLRQLSFSVITERMVMRVRNLALQRILRQDVGWFDVSSDHTAGALVSQLGTDCFLLKALTGERASLALSQCAVVGGGLYVAFSSSWQLTLVIFGIIPVIVIPVVLQAKVVAKYAEASTAAFVDAGRSITEALVQVRVIAALGIEEQRVRDFSELMILPRRQEVRKGFAMGVGTGVAAGCILFGASFKYIVGGIFFDQGWLEFGDIMRCALVLIFMAFGINAVSKDATGKAEATVAARRVFKLVNAKSAIDPFDESGDAPEGRAAGRIEYAEIVFAYPARKEQVVCSGLSLTIEAGRTVGLVGPSGSGKSTLVALLERFYDPDSGKVMLDGVDIRSLRVTWLRSQIGLVSQEPVLFSGTIAWNIGLGHVGAQAASMEQIEEAAKKANAHSFVMDFPDKYSTQVGERAIQLSGGQKQRLAIARAIIRNPPILLLDEATSALDAASEQVVQAALDELLEKHGCTTLIIAHRLSTIRHADKIAVCSQGAIVEEGNYDELLKREGGFFRALVTHAESGAVVGKESIQNDNEIRGTNVTLPGA